MASYTCTKPQIRRVVYTLSMRRLVDPILIPLLSDLPALLLLRPHARFPTCLSQLSNVARWPRPHGLALFPAGCTVCTHFIRESFHDYSFKNNTSISPPFYSSLAFLIVLITTYQNVIQLFVIKYLSPLECNLWQKLSSRHYTPRA